MTRQEWEVFVPLMQDFMKSLEEVNKVITGNDLAHPLDVYSEEIEYYAEEYSRCDGSWYYSAKANAKFFIDGEKEEALQQLKDEREEAARVEAYRKRKEEEARQERVKQAELAQLEALKKKYE